MSRSTTTDLDTAAAASFHRFPDLPPELRALIYELCLPNRVRELNELDPSYLWPDWQLHDSRPCWLSFTTKVNNRPPLIAQVCQEARRVAFVAIGLQSPARSDQTGLLCWDPQQPWTDPIRDIPYFHDGPTDSHTLTTLTNPGWAQAHGRSFWYGYLQKYPAEGDCAQYDAHFSEELPDGGEPPRLDLPDPEQHPKVHQDCLVLLQHTNWLLVVDTIVIHATATSAAASGLFGLLCDAPIQIVNASDADKLSLYWQMADAGESTADERHLQKYYRQPLERLQLWIRRKMWCNKYPDALQSHMRPAIMFRLCTRMCNQKDQLVADPRTPESRGVLLQRLHELMARMQEYDDDFEDEPWS